MNESAGLVRFEELRSLSFTSISGTYAGVGASFQNPVRLIKVHNTTDGNLIISYDGIKDHDFVVAGGAYVYDYASNKNVVPGQLDQPVGDRVYVKEESTAVTSGTVYVIVQYADSK